MHPASVGESNLRISPPTPLPGVNVGSGPDAKGMTMGQNINKGEKPKPDLYRDITDKIIVEMEQGRLPWVQPWNATHAACAEGLPKNAATHNTYSGINTLTLWGAVIEYGYRLECTDISAEAHGPNA